MLLLAGLPAAVGLRPPVRSEAVRQAGEAVDLLGHHPSIVQWCAHNEPIAGRAGRSRATTSVRRGCAFAAQQLPTWNKTVLDRWVKRAFERADPTRPGRRPLRRVAPPPAARRHRQPPVVRLVPRRRARPRRAAADIPPGALRQRVRRPGRARDAPTSSTPATGPTSTGTTARATTAAEGAFDERAVPPTSPTFDAWRHGHAAYQAELMRHHIETLRRLKYRPTGGFCFFALADPAR